MSGKFDQNLVSRIQQASDIVEVISEHLALQRKGRDFVGLCPFHADHRPSMYVSPSKQIFKCFACGAGGDVFKFIQLRENLSFPLAIQRLAERAGIVFEASQRRTNDGIVDEVDPRELARINVAVQRWFVSNLKDPQKGKVAREYIDKRKINAESVQRWGLGYALDGWDSLVSTAGKKIGDKMLVAAGLAVTSQEGRCYDKFRHRLMFPIVDVTGRVIAFGGRTLGDDPAKYMNSPATPLFDKSQCMYGLDQARQEIGVCGTAVVVEGYTDVIMCHQFGCRNVVATLGTSFTDGHARLLRRYAKRIVLVFDSDTAGREAANRAMEVCLSQKIDIQLAFVTEGKDPCDFLLAAGAEAFRRILENAIDIMDYKWRRLQDELAGSGTQMEHRAAVEDYLKSVALAARTFQLDPVAKGWIGNKLANLTGMKEYYAREEIARFFGRMEKNSGFAQPNQQVVSLGTGKDIRVRAQAEIISVLLNEPKLFDSFRDRMELDWFTEPAYRPIAEALWSRLREGREVTEAGLLTEIEDPASAAALVDLSEIGRVKQRFADRLSQAIETLEDLERAQQLRRIRATLTDEDTQQLRAISEMLSKKNVRNPGLLPR
ncbi:MAG: DNA primase [Phycisphaerae bacterium]|nr:DNA primase [Phycisphaerae bacterium]